MPPALLPGMSLELAVSVVASMVTIAVLHLVLWHASPRAYLLWWAAAWLAFALRYSPTLFGLRLGVESPMVGFAPIREVCLIIGASLYAERRWWRWLVLLPALELAALVSGLLARPSWADGWTVLRPALGSATSLLVAYALATAPRPAPIERRLAASGYAVFAVNAALAAMAVRYELRFLVDQIGYLVGSVSLALAELEAAGQARSIALSKLSAAMALVLRGHVNVCTRCHRIEDSSQDWNPPERFVSGHTHANISRGICDDCLNWHFGDLMSAERAP